MSGQVLIVHQDSSGAAEPFRLEAEHVVADMEPQEDQPAAHKKATAGAASSPGNSGQKIKRLSADGAVHFSSRQIQFDAEQVTYDPTEDVLMARGAQDVPVQVYDEKGVSTGAFEEIWWNSRTQQIVRLSNLRGDIRR